MKARVVKTCFWVDEKTQALPKEAKLLFIYLLTCERIGLTGTFPIPDSHILGDTGLTPSEFLKAKQELEVAKRVRFHNGWVRVINAGRHNQFRNSPKNEKPFNEELVAIPSDILAFFDTGIDTPIDTHQYPITSNKKLVKEGGVGETSKLNRELKVTPEQITELKSEFPSVDVDIELDNLRDWLASTGKVKKDYWRFVLVCLRKKQQEIGSRRVGMVDGRNLK